MQHNKDDFVKNDKKRSTATGPDKANDKDDHLVQGEARAYSG